MSKKPYTQGEVQRAMITAFGDKGRDELKLHPMMLGLITRAINKAKDCADLVIDGSWKVKDVATLKRTLKHIRKNERATIHQ